MSWPRLLLGSKPPRQKKEKTDKKEKKSWKASLLDFLGMRLLDLLEGKWNRDLWDPHF